MNSPSPSTITLLVLIPLFAWRISRRFRRMVGPQRLSKVRLRVTLLIYPALLGLLGFAMRAHPEGLWWLAVGVGCGAWLGLFGLKKTRFEATPKGLFYTPHAHLGIALSLLFVARIVYRLFEVYVREPTTPHGMNELARSPLTLVVFGLLASYYITYAVGLVRWRGRVLRSKQRREARKLRGEKLMPDSRSAEPLPSDNAPVG